MCFMQYRINELKSKEMNKIMSVNNLPGARAAFPTPALDLAMMFLVTAFYHIRFGRYNRIWFYGKEFECLYSISYIRFLSLSLWRVLWF